MILIQDCARFYDIVCVRVVEVVSNRIKMLTRIVVSLKIHADYLLQHQQ